MKMKPTKTLTFLMLFALSSSMAQTFTMGKKCQEAYASAQAALSAKSYQDALALYDAFSEDCKTKDAKILASEGKAEAYNGLGMHAEAIAEADDVLKRTKDRSLAGHFQKAVALNATGDIEGSKAQLESVMELTEMNQNTAQRASNYALMAALYDRQMGQMDSAMVYLNKAKELDPGNVNYILQEGDMYLVQDDFKSAYAVYDEAARLYPDSQEVYVSKSNAGLKEMNKKYGTSKAQDLREMMSDAEKATICGDLARAMELGYKDMNKEMFKALVCQ
jgi:tetratricopeptide (TPR) repeat protein